MSFILVILLSSILTSLILSFNYPTQTVAASDAYQTICQFLGTCEQFTNTPPPPGPSQDPGLDPNLPGANNLQELCDDDVDNDRDGSVDEDECFSAPAQRIESQCSDGIDNDKDGASDRQDADCIGKPIPPLDEGQPSQLSDLQVIPGQDRLSDLIPQDSNTIVSPDSMTTPLTPTTATCTEEQHYDEIAGECVDNKYAQMDGSCVAGYHFETAPEGNIPLCVKDVPAPQTTQLPAPSDGTTPVCTTPEVLDPDTGECRPMSAADAAQPGCEPQSVVEGENPGCSPLDMPGNTGPAAPPAEEGEGAPPADEGQGGDNGDNNENGGNDSN